MLERDNLIRGLGVVEMVYRLLHGCAGTAGQQTMVCIILLMYTNLKPVISSEKQLLMQPQVFLKIKFPAYFIDLADRVKRDFNF